MAKSKNEVEIKFKAETAEFRNAIKQANSTMTQLRGELKLNAAQMKNTGTSVERLTRKKKLLEQQDQTLQQKIAALAQQLEASNAAFGENSAQSQRLTNQLNSAKTAQENVRAQIAQTNSAIKEQQAAEKSAESAYTQLSNKIREQKSKLEELKTEYASAVIAKGKDSAEAKTLEGKIRELNSELQQNVSRMDAAESAARELAGEEQRLGSSAKEAGDGFTVAKGIVADFASNALQQIIDKAKETATATVELGATFESSLSNVKALSGASAQEMDQLEAKARELGSTTNFSASQVADAFGYMALAGWDTQQSLDGINGVLTLAQAGSMDLAAASDLLTDYLSAFGLQASDSATMVDVLAYAQGNANTNVTQLGDAFKNCAANCHAAGMDVQTTTAFISELSNQGLKGSEAGTALSAVMRDLTAKMQDGSIAIGDTKVAVQDASGNYRDMVDIIADIEQATNGMGDAQKASALQSTFTSDSIKGLNMILGAGSDSLRGFRDELYGSNGAAQEMASTMTDNLNGDISSMNSALEELGLKIYDKLQTPLRETVQFITGTVIPGITSFLENLDQIAPVLVGVGVAIAAFVIILNFSTICAAVAGAVGAVGTAIGLIASPIGIVAALIGAFVALLIHLWNTNDGFRNTVTGAWNTISSAISSAVSAIMPIVQALIDFFLSTIVPAVMSVAEGFGMAFANILAAAAAWAAGILGAIQGAMTFIQGVIDMVLGVIVGLFTGNFTMAKQGAETALNGLAAAASSIMNGISGALSGILNGIASVFSGIFNGIKSTVSGALQAVVGYFGDKLGLAKSTVKGALDTISGFFSGVKLQLPHINLPHFSISGKFSLDPPSIPHIGVEWYANGAILQRPTLFGMNGSSPMVGGEAGPEAITPLARLQDFIDDTMSRWSRPVNNNVNITVNAQGGADDIADAVAYRVFGAIDQAMAANGR